MQPICTLIAAALVAVSMAGCRESEADKLARSMNEQMAARKRELEERQKHPMTREEFSKRVGDPFAAPEKQDAKK